MPEGCRWKTSGGRKDEDERIRWEAWRCHFRKGKGKKIGDLKKKSKKHEESFSGCHLFGWFVVDIKKE